MDELAKALAEAVTKGAVLAGPAFTAYLHFRIWDDVISYGVPWGMALVACIFITRARERA